MIASAYDYCVFLEALCKDDLLSESAFAEMTDWFDTGRDYFYGLGLYKYPTDYGYYIGHEGTTMGGGSGIYYFPDSNVTIVVCTNLSTAFSSPLLEAYAEFKLELLKTVMENL